MIHWNLLIILLLVITDGFAIWDVIGRKHFSLGRTFLWIAIIVLIPIIGVSLYYFRISRLHRNRSFKH